MDHELVSEFYQYFYLLQIIIDLNELVSIMIEIESRFIVIARGFYEAIFPCSPGDCFVAALLAMTKELNLFLHTKIQET